MTDIYKEKLCRSPTCPFVGRVFEPVLIAETEIRYIDCQRDNEDVKKHFLHTLKNDNNKWSRQEVNFGLCLFAPENTKGIIE